MTFQGMSKNVLPDSRERRKPISLVIGSRKLNFGPEQYTCLVEGKIATTRKEDVVNEREVGGKNDENKGQPEVWEGR